MSFKGAYILMPTFSMMAFHWDKSASYLKTGSINRKVVEFS